MSSDNAKEPHNSTSRGILRPVVPKPNTSSEAVRAFLIQFFRALNYDRTLHQAIEIAQMLNVDRGSLYETPEKLFFDTFGTEGKTIYSALQRSKYGYDSSYWPRPKMVGATLVFTGTFEGLLEYWRKKDFRIFIFSILCTILTTLLGLINLSCRSRAVIDSTRLAEGLKIRRERN